MAKPTKRIFNPRECTKCSKPYTPLGSRGNVCPTCNPKKPKSSKLPKASRQIASKHITMLMCKDAWCGSDKVVLEEVDPIKMSADDIFNEGNALGRLMITKCSGTFLNGLLHALDREPSMVYRKEKP